MHSIISDNIQLITITYQSMSHFLISYKTKQCYHISIIVGITNNYCFPANFLKGEEEMQTGYCGENIKKTWERCNRGWRLLKWISKTSVDRVCTYFMWIGIRIGGEFFRRC